MDREMEGDKEDGVDLGGIWEQKWELDILKIQCMKFSKKSFKCYMKRRGLFNNKGERLKSRFWGLLRES